MRLPLPFREAREWARTLAAAYEWHTKSAYLEAGRSGERPPELVDNPDEVYKDDGWAGWLDWLVGVAAEDDESSRSKEGLSGTAAVESVNPLSTFEVSRSAGPKSTADVEVSVRYAGKVFRGEYANVQVGTVAKVLDDAMQTIEGGAKHAATATAATAGGIGGSASPEPSASAPRTPSQTSPAERTAPLSNGNGGAPPTGPPNASSKPAPNHAHATDRPRSSSPPGELSAAQGLDVNADGSFAGATRDMHKDTAVQTPGAIDSGTHYRTRQPRAAVGPRQLAPAEVVSPDDGPLRVAGRGMFRVNPESSQRAFPLEGYETESYIDEDRSIDVVDNAGGVKIDPVPEGGRPGATPVREAVTEAMFETCAVGAKLRNTHLVGGERVKAMDHFVASVEVPLRSVVIPDIAKLVIAACERHRAPVAVDGCFDVHVQAKYREGENGDRVSAVIADQARAFRSMLYVICSDVLLLPMDQIRMHYTTTMRADRCVATRSAEDGLIYVNLLVFQQMGCAADFATTGTVRGPESKPRRPWAYWTQRLAMADGAPPPTGLYDPEVRRRFDAKMDQLGLPKK